MKRTIEYTLLILGTICSILGIIFTFILKALSTTQEFKSGFTESLEQEAQNNPDIPNDIDAVQMMITMKLFANVGVVILIVSILLAIVAIIFVKKQNVLSGVFAIVAGLTSIITVNIISFLLFIIAGIMLFVRNNNAKDEFEPVNFQKDNHNNRESDDSNYQEQQNLNDNNKKKKDDDPYIY